MINSRARGTSVYQIGGGNRIERHNELIVVIRCSTDQCRIMGPIFIGSLHIALIVIICYEVINRFPFGFVAFCRDKWACLLLK